MCGQTQESQQVACIVTTLLYIFNVYKAQFSSRLLEATITSTAWSIMTLE